MWRDLSRSAQTELVLPDILAERCVHSLAEKATCRACADACPRDAWVIDEDILGIDSELCDGCDLCVPACPQGAIARRFAPAIKRTGDVSAVFASCERSDVIGISEGLMPCLHAMGTIDLLEMSRSDVDYVITSSGDCDVCPRGKTVRLERRVEDVNALFSARGMKSLQYRKLDGNRWTQAFRTLSEADGLKPINRRAFFQKAAETSSEKLNQALAKDSGSYVPPGVLLPRRSGNEPLPFVPGIDATRCDGCDACVRLCPYQAIRLDGDEGGPIAYRIEPEQCSGCRLCLDVCEQHAVKLSRWNEVFNDRILLHSGRCRACGVVFHLPANGRELPELCRICSHTNHYENLYQVLD